MYLKTAATLIFSLVIALALTKTVFYEEQATLRPDFMQLFERLSSPVVGSKGEAIEPGVDPTPPSTIYY